MPLCCITSFFVEWFCGLKPWADQFAATKRGIHGEHHRLPFLWLRNHGTHRLRSWIDLLALQAIGTWPLLQLGNRWLFSWMENGSWPKDDVAWVGKKEQLCGESAAAFFKPYVEQWDQFPVEKRTFTTSNENRCYHYDLPDLEEYTLT